MTAESQGIREGDINDMLLRVIGYVIQVAFWIRVVEINGGWNHAVPNGKSTGNGFYSAGGAEQMTGH